MREEIEIEIRTLNDLHFHGNSIFGSILVLALLKLNRKHIIILKLTFNKTGLQPVSRPVEQIIGFFIKI